MFNICLFSRSIWPYATKPMAGQYLENDNEKHQLSGIQIVLQLLQEICQVPKSIADIW